ncbi:ABC transporter ATP-binding protein [Vallitalea sediminicola]
MDNVTNLKCQNNSVKPKYNVFKNIIFMVRLAWTERKWVLILCVLTASLSVGLSLLKLLITPVILSEVEAVVPLGQLIKTILLFAGALLLVDTVHSFFATIIPFEHNSFRIIIASHITQKIVKASYPLTEDQDVLRKLDRANMYNIGNDSTTLAFWVKLSNLFKNIAGFIIYLVMFSYIELWIIIVILVTTVTGFFVNKRIYKWSYEHRDEEAEYSQRMNYISNKARKGSIAKDIRLFNMGRWLEDIYSSTLKVYQSFLARENRVYIWGNVVDVVLSFARNGVAYIYLIGLVLYDGLSASQFLLLFTAVGGITIWVSGILSCVIDLNKDSLEISTLREFLEYDEPFVFEGGESLEPDPFVTYQIKLKNVSFRYKGAKQDTLKNINLTIKPGEKLAVVGLNGAGKSTLVKLICGFYDPTEGEVLLNGVNIKKYNRRDYYRHFSAVFQETSLLPISIAENISQANNSFDMEKIRDCVEKAGLTQNIEKLPQKYKTNLSKDIFDDGIELSGGETQRLLLARALYKSAPIIILDEPTAALDPIAESEIYNKYHEITGNRTSVYISHRLASTRFCDRIILIGDKTILEEGTHDNLIRQGGKYFELFEVQSRYYRENEDQVMETTDKEVLNCD